MRLPDRELRGVVHRDVLNGGQRPRPAELDVSHVADIKEADAGAHGHVLGHQAGVFHRHIPSAKIDHLGAKLAMHRIQCSFTK